MFKADHAPYPALMLTLADLEQGKPLEGIQTRLESIALNDPSDFAMPPEMMKMMGNVIPKGDGKLKIYRAAVEEMRRCVEDAKAVPDLNLKGVCDVADSPYVANCEYIFGRLCEFRGRQDDAIAWYEKSMKIGDWTSTCRPMAGAALRRLGRPYYK